MIATPISGHYVGGIRKSCAGKDEATGMKGAKPIKLTKQGCLNFSDTNLFKNVWGKGADFWVGDEIVSAYLIKI